MKTISHSLATVLLAHAICWKTFAADFQLGTVATGGPTAGLPVTLANAGTNLSAFAFYIATPHALGLPGVAAGPAQTNLVSFVDDFSNGIARVTGFVLNGSSIGTGHIATLEWVLPAGLAAGSYPVTILGNTPAQAVPAPNPEARSLATSSLLPATGRGGAIIVSGLGLRLMAPRLLQEGRFEFDFTGSAGGSYTVYGSTNLHDWVPLGPATELGGGAFVFIDTDAAQLRSRFYQVRQP